MYDVCVGMYYALVGDNDDGEGARPKIISPDDTRVWVLIWFSADKNGGETHAEAFRLFNRLNSAQRRLDGFETRKRERSPTVIFTKRLSIGI